MVLFHYSKNVHDSGPGYTNTQIMISDTNIVLIVMRRMHTPMLRVTKAVYFYASLIVIHSKVVDALEKQMYHY